MNRRRTPPRESPRHRPPRLARFLLARCLAPRNRQFILADLDDSFAVRARSSRPAAITWYWWQVPFNVFGGLRAQRRSRRPLTPPRAVGNRGLRSIFGELIRETRFALRNVAQKPGIYATAVLAMAIGVGANTAVFSVVDGVLLRPLPYFEPQNLGLIWAHDPETGNRYLEIAERDLDKLGTAPGLEALVAFGENSSLLTDTADEPERVDSAYIYGDLFGTLGVDLAAGRAPTQAEIDARDRVVVVGDGLWRRRYRAATDILGRVIDTDMGPQTVIGVAPPGFDFPTGSMLWSTPPDWASGDDWMVSVLARRGAGTGVATLSDHLGVLELHGQGGFLVEKDRLAAWYEPLHEATVADARIPLLLLISASASILLLASLNVANLLLARGLTRRPEFALRAALGAGRGRIALQVVIESMVVSALGGALALLAVMVSFEAVLALVPDNLPRADEIAYDGRVVWAMASIVAGSGLALSLIPALRTSTISPGLGLQNSLRGSTPAEGQRLQSLLMAAQVAFTTILVVGAAVMVLTLRNLGAVDPGFRPDVLTVRAMNVGWPAVTAGDGGVEPADLWRTILDDVAALPGVQNAATAALHPMERGFVVNVDVVGNEAEPAQRPVTMFFPVSAGYIETLGIPLRAGRNLDERDDAGSAGVALVNEAFVRHYLDERDPIGQRIHKLNAGGSWGASEQVEIVGVVGDVKSEGLRNEAAPTMYVPLRQAPFGYLRLFLRSAGDPKALIPQIRSIIWAVDPTVALPRFELMDEVVRDSVSQERFLSRVIGVFAVLALLLSVVGVYGVVSASTARRTREIGIRRALGADSSSVVRLVLRWAAWRIGIGMVAGLLGAALLSRVLQGLLFGITTMEPIMLAGVSAVITLAAAAAVHVPVRRAVAVDPSTALRAE